MNNNKEKFYLTTAIAYTSKKPHIGNTYEAIFADAIARYKRIKGYDVYFLTGTDEHGQKIQELAEEAKKSPKEYVDEIANEIKDIWNLMNVSYSKFIRTTDDYHEEAVKKIFKKLYDQGDIYLGRYEGMYCTPCETFYTESQLIDNKCPDCTREVKKASEEAYFLKCSKYQDKLIEYIESNIDFIEPESRKKEIMNNFLKAGLQDLCVSRTSFSWGVPVSFDNKHVVYVWIDALSNYITGLGYSVDKKDDLYNKNWPADIHIIGKDILRFHAIYWPIILMALGEPLPKKIYAHGWMLTNEDKMSKSKGNVIYADYLAKKTSVDAVRYYCLSEMAYSQDGNISYENVLSKYNSDLANTLGNLVNRVIAMINKYFNGYITDKHEYEEIDNNLKEYAANAVKKYEQKMDGLRVQEAIIEAMNFTRRANKYIDETLPWLLAKEKKDKRLSTVLYNLIECIRIIAVMIYPIMPGASKNIISQIKLNEKDIVFESIKEFGTYNQKAKLEEPNPIFVRIDEEKKMDEIKEDIEKTNKSVSTKSHEEISFEEFEKIKLVVGKILNVERIEDSDKLYKLEVDIKEETRIVVSGLVKYYTPEELLGKKVIMIKNLKPVKLRGVESNGMLLAAGTDTFVRLLEVDERINIGDSVS